MRLAFLAVSLRVRRLSYTPLVSASSMSPVRPDSAKGGAVMAPPLERIVSALLVPLFLFSAAVQYNDPDPVRWAAIYLAAMAVCLGHALRPMTPLPGALVAGVALIWAAIWTPGALKTLPSFGDATKFQMMAPGVEEVRELLGLLIVVVATGLLALRARQRARRTVS
jgi:Transmembrane family 220, helix